MDTCRTVDASRPAAGSIDRRNTGGTAEVSQTTLGQEEFLHSTAHLFELDNVITLCRHFEIQGVALS